MPVGVRIDQIEHVLRAVGQILSVRHGFGRGEDPLGVLAGQVGVEIDHLRLEPQAELHAEAMDVRGQPVEAVGPDFRVDPPIAQPLGVVAAFVEPAIVEHEALHADRSRTVGEPLERGLVVVEVHGLPGVERERPRLGGGVHAARQRAQPVVESRGDAVEAAVGVGEADFRRGIRFAGRKADLAGAEKLAGADKRFVGR